MNWFRNARKRDRKKAAREGTPPATRVFATLMVKNEGKGIADAVCSAAKCCDQVLVVDTGSDDDTVLAARVAGKTCNACKVTIAEIEPVYYMTADECDDGKPRIDFGAMRNAVLQTLVATTDIREGDWILSLDGDEVLRGGAKLGDSLRGYKGNAQAMDIGITSVTDDSEAYSMATRLWRHSPEVYWEFPVHNVLTLPDGARRGHIARGLASIRASYEGGTDQTSLPVLKKMFDHEDFEGIAHGYKLHASGYYGIALYSLGRFEEAVEVLTWTISDVERGTSPVHASSWLILCSCYTQLGDLRKAAFVAHQAALAQPDSPDARWAGMLIAYTRWCKTLDAENVGPNGRYGNVRVVSRRHFGNAGAIGKMLTGQL